VPASVRSHINDIPLASSPLQPLAPRLSNREPGGKKNNKVENQRHSVTRHGFNHRYVAGRSVPIPLFSVQPPLLRLRQKSLYRLAKWRT
jgi:hypothetical protein